MLLVDTHIVVWLAQETHKLSRRAIEGMSKARIESKGLAISTTTLWELAWLSATNKLRFEPPLEVFLERVERTYHVLPLDRNIALRGVKFSSAFPRDPADRQIAATAIVHNLKLVTADGGILKSGEVPCIW